MNPSISSLFRHVLILVFRLGADHDGSGGSAACPAANLNLMTSSGSVSTISYTFSSCSIQAFKNTVATQRCLDNIPTPTPDLALVANVSVGQIFDVTGQCKLVYGPDAVFAGVLSSKRLLIYRC